MKVQFFFFYYHFNLALRWAFLYVFFPFYLKCVTVVQHMSNHTRKITEFVFFVMQLSHWTAAK